MKLFIETLLSSKAFKAWSAAVVAGVAVIATAVTDQVVTGEEVGVLVGAFLAALGITFRVPNAKDDVN